MDWLPLVLAVSVVRAEVFETFDALPEAVNCLFATAGVFNSLAWWRTVVAYGMPTGARPCFLLCRSDDTPIGLFPLRRPARGGGLESLTTPYTCLYEPLLAPGLDAATQMAVLAALTRYCRGWATTRLDSLAEDSPILSAVIVGALAGGLVAVRFAHFGNWHEDVRGLDWPTYLARRPGALRETVRRKLRRVERLQNAHFNIVRDGAALEIGITAYEYVYGRSWKGAEPFPKFIASLMRALSARKTLRLGLLRMGDIPIAAQFWIVERGTATVLKLAHDEAFQAESPGTVLTALMLRTLLDEEHVSEIDFGRGDDPYKRAWASERRQRIGLVLANPHRPAAWLFLTKHRIGQAAASLQQRTPLSLQGWMGR